MGCLYSSESHKKATAFGRYRFEDTDIKDSNFNGINFLTECPTLHALDIGNMTSSCCTFQSTKLLKTTKPDNHFGVVKFIIYFLDWSYHVASCIEEHLIRTKPLRLGRKDLLISYIKPHCTVSTNTISRWLKEVLRFSAI